MKRLQRQTRAAGTPITSSVNLTRRVRPRPYRTFSKKPTIAGALCATSRTTVTGVAPPSAPPPPPLPLPSCAPPPRDEGPSPACCGCCCDAAAVDAGALASTSTTSKRHGGRCDRPRLNASWDERDLHVGERFVFQHCRQGAVKTAVEIHWVYLTARLHMVTHSLHCSVGGDTCEVQIAP